MSTIEYVTITALGLAVGALAVDTIWRSIKNKWRETIEQRSEKTERDLRKTSRQLAAVQSTLRTLITGSSDSARQRAEQERQKQEAYGPVHVTAVRSHDSGYCAAIYPSMASRKDVRDFVLSGVTLSIRGVHYNLYWHEVEEYMNDRSGYVVARSSCDEENAGTGEWAYLTDEAHELLCTALKAVYGASGEEES